MRICVKYPDGTKTRLSNVFLHEKGFLCRLRPEARGLVRTNWAKRGGSLVLEAEPDQVQHVPEPLICPGKVEQVGLSQKDLQALLDSCRPKRDYSPLLNDELYKPVFFTLGDNGNGYWVEVLGEE